MKKIIHKYFLKFERKAGIGFCSLDVPIGTDILKIGQQKNNICAWVAIDPDQKELQVIELEMYSTGATIEGYREHISTVEFFDGEEVYHFFKKPN
jgi:hypothetical protein